MPTDEGVLNTLAYTFKACRAEKDLARCYENALKVQPNRESFMCDLFFCYLRLGDPKKMQRLAQQLYKLTGRPKYVFWSVNSMVQQEDLPMAMLTVAERMIEKVSHLDYIVGTHNRVVLLSFVSSMLLAFVQTPHVQAKQIKLTTYFSIALNRDPSFCT